jgi:hypothetical protein
LAWQAWQLRRQSIPRRIRTRFAHEPDEPILSAAPGDVDVVISVRSTNASKAAALLEPIRHLRSSRVGIVSDIARTSLLPAADAARATPANSATIIAGPRDRPVTAVVPHGVGRPHEVAIRAARQSGGRVFVVQHGLLTPFAPPLPRDCTLLAWSAADGDFWRSGRRDVDIEVVGSQLLWVAAQRAAAVIDPDARPTFLGQLHAAEIARRELARVSYRFCHETGAVYRPHPAETDKVSRAQHALWRRRGVAFDTSGVALENLETPVAAIFSTGVLEAAAAGRPAWGYHPDPPAWVAEMWDRYGVARWGSDPTPPPKQPTVEPAARVAEIVAAATASTD